MRLIGLMFSLVAMTANTAHAASDDTFCWKDSYTRDVGTMSNGCDSTQGQAQTGLCYHSCPAGMTGVGPVCWSQCPAGYTDMGAVCHINLALTVSPNWVCTNYWPGWMGGACAIWATQCPSGYTNAGLFCALNAQPVPAGFSGTYLDPMKNTYARGAGTIPHGCPVGKEWNSGLCYNTCNTGYYGVGPVCWTYAPKTWVECGMGGAKDTGSCASVVFSQVSSVLMLAANIATLGSSSAVEEGATVAQDAGKIAELTAKLKALKDKVVVLKDTVTKAYPKLTEAVNDANAARKDIQAAKKLADNTAALSQVTDATPPEDIARIAAELASLVDPTGAASVVSAYTYPKCSVLFH